MPGPYRRLGTSVHSNRNRSSRFEERLETRQILPVRSAHRKGNERREQRPEACRSASISKRHPAAAVSQRLERVGRLHRKQTRRGTHAETPLGYELDHFVGIRQPATPEKARDERDL